MRLDITSSSWPSYRFRTHRIELTLVDNLKGDFFAYAETWEAPTNDHSRVVDYLINLPSMIVKHRL